MNVLPRLTRIFTAGNEPDRDAILPEVRRLYTAAVGQARLLERHAGMAPDEAARVQLTHLSRAEEQYAERLRKVIGRLDAFAGDVAVSEAPAAAVNHWGRLGQDLEAHREAIKGLLDLGARVTNEQPEMADTLRELARDEEIHGLRIRALIARSDPQALD